jgi:type I restriction enzyme R subunit
VIATDTSEKGLESLIVAAMTGGGATDTHSVVHDSVRLDEAHLWIASRPEDYDREYAVDLQQLRAFLLATQEGSAKAFDLFNASATRRAFLARLQGEISKRGVIDVLRNGIKHGPHHVDLFYGTPSRGNLKAAGRFALNRFSVTRQLKYSRDETQLALDLALFINGLPIATFELKNSLTKQTVEDAVQQYKRDRDPLHGALRRGRPRSAHVHASQGQGFVVPAFQPWLERWRGQPAEP